MTEPRPRPLRTGCRSSRHASSAGRDRGADRNWAAAAHWGTLVAAWLAMGFLAPADRAC